MNNFISIVCDGAVNFEMFKYFHPIGYFDSDDRSFSFDGIDFLFYFLFHLAKMKKPRNFIFISVH